jgi:hypothetical protein
MTPGSRSGSAAPQQGLQGIGRVMLLSGRRAADATSAPGVVAAAAVELEVLHVAGEVYGLLLLL